MRMYIQHTYTSNAKKTTCCSTLSWRREKHHNNNNNIVERRPIYHIIAYSSMILLCSTVSRQSPRCINIIIYGINTPSHLDSSITIYYKLLKVLGREGEHDCKIIVWLDRMKKNVNNECSGDKHFGTLSQNDLQQLRVKPRR